MTSVKTTVSHEHYFLGVNHFRHCLHSMLYQEYRWHFVQKDKPTHNLPLNNSCLTWQEIVKVETNTFFYFCQIELINKDKISCKTSNWTRNTTWTKSVKITLQDQITVGLEYLYELSFTIIIYISDQVYLLASKLLQSYIQLYTVLVITVSSSQHVHSHICPWPQWFWPLVSPVFSLLVSAPHCAPGGCVLPQGCTRQLLDHWTDVLVHTCGWLSWASWVSWSWSSALLLWAVDAHKWHWFLDEVGEVCPYGASDWEWPWSWRTQVQTRKVQSAMLPKWHNGK